jgi:aminoglycoside phosphotransferase family enzyme/predicted kinase
LKSKKRKVDELVRLLSDPAAFLRPPPSVEVHQTHGSCVFLAGQWAYKMKKGVKYAFFDFSTLKKRRAALERELVLNRRLAPGVYRDVVPVLEEKEGGLRVDPIGDKDEAVEFLLRMRRLPEDRFLPEMLARGEGNRALMKRVADKMANFHRSAERGPHIKLQGDPEHLGTLFMGNLEECVALPGAVGPGETTVNASRRAFERMLHQLGPILLARASEDFIRDLHGDFRMEHVVFLDDEVVIFDCIDFRDDFRYMDPAHEIASFVMELREEGYAEEARDFILAYLDASEDDAMLPLLSLYLLHRALVRGKVEALKAEAPGVPSHERRLSKGLSERHFETAKEIAIRESAPRLVLIGGLMASGKSALAEGLHATGGLSLHRSDPTRKEIAGLGSTVRAADPWGAGLYSAEMTSRVYKTLLKKTRADLKVGGDVVVDASFSRRSEREAFFSLAQEMGARFGLLECVCSAEERRARLERRVQRGNSVSDGRIEIMDAQEAAFEPIDEPHIAIDTSGPKSSSLAKGLRAVYIP